jgi:hypothetical protein
MFESQRADSPEADRQITLERAEFALRHLLLAYLSELAHEGTTPAAHQFGVDVIEASADVLTFNYDTLAEEAIESASGLGPKPDL